MPPRIITGYGRRLRRTRVPINVVRRVVHRPRQVAAPPRPRPVSNLASDAQVLANLRKDYTTGRFRRVPRSVFSDISSPATSQRYTNIADQIATFMREESQWRDDEIRASRDKATSHIDSATALTSVANAMNESRETMLNDAARLLAKSANLLKTVTILEKDYDMVFVYDIDEITMLSRSYIAEFLALYPEIDPYALYKFTEKVISSVELTLSEIKKMDVLSMYYAPESESDYWRRVGPKYEALRVLYNEMSEAYREGDPAISYELCDKVGMVDEVQRLKKSAVQFQKRTHQRWRRVRKCLDLVNQKSRVSPRKYANVVLCEEGVAYGCAQLLVSNQSSQIAIENVYSTSSRPKREVFKKLETRFGETCVFVYVSSSTPSDISDMRQVRHWPVEAADSIKQLYKAMQKNILQ